MLALIEPGPPLSALASVIVPYPTYGGAIKRLADQALRDRLKGWPFRVTRWWFGTRQNLFETIVMAIWSSSIAAYEAFGRS